MWSLSLTGTPVLGEADAPAPRQGPHLRVHVAGA